MAIAILGDTHMPKGSRRLPEQCIELLRGSELIVHTGDFTGVEALELIAGLGPPLIAVHGNVDEAAVVDRLPEATTFALGAHRIGLIHDAGAKRGRLERMRRRFPDAAAVLFGHSHMPLHEGAGDTAGGGDAGSAAERFEIFNPGSPTERRRAPRPSMGLAEIDRAGRLEPRHVWLD